MSAIILLLLGLGGMAAGYFVYSRFIASRIYKLEIGRASCRERV